MLGVKEISRTFRTYKTINSKDLQDHKAQVPARVAILSWNDFQEDFQGPGNPTLRTLGGALPGSLKLDCDCYLGTQHCKECDRCNCIL